MLRNLRGDTMNYYYSDGRKYTGKVHKMPNGEIHTGEVHTSRSVRVFPFSQLSAAAKRAANRYA